MHQSFFYKLFPPPKFLLMPHVGINISDDSISFIEYSKPVGNRIITKFGCVPLGPSIVEGGDIKDEIKFIEILTDLADTYNLSYAKLSIPEEKAYLFETEISYGDLNTISQNIEFKLEENIPLSASDAVFAFDLLPGDHGRPWRASVSAVPRTYIEHMMNLFRKAGINPVAFETIPRAVARIVSDKNGEDIIVIHVMNRKTGVYIVSGQAVGFTSTIGVGISELDMSTYTDSLAEEVRRVYTYWLGKNENGGTAMKKVVVVGQQAPDITLALRNKVADILPVYEADVWHSILDTSHYVPPIVKEDSFDYASSAGLAL